MKKKIIVLFSAMFVFALSGAANTGAEKSAATRCPMQKQNGTTFADNQKGFVLRNG